MREHNRLLQGDDVRLDWCGVVCLCLRHRPIGHANTPTRSRQCARVLALVVTLRVPPSIQRVRQLIHSHSAIARYAEWGMGKESFDAPSFAPVCCSTFYPTLVVTARRFIRFNQSGTNISRQYCLLSTRNLHCPSFTIRPLSYLHGVQHGLRNQLADAYFCTLAIEVVTPGTLLHTSCLREALR